ERGQGMDVGTGRIMTRSVFYLGNSQRGTVRAARECTLPVECLVLPEYQVLFPLAVGARCSSSTALRVRKGPTVEIHCESSRKYDTVRPHHDDNGHKNRLRRQDDVTTTSDGCIINAFQP